MLPPKLLVIAGPTASGKSELALKLASGLDAEIINADSMQVYRGMDVGTAKPSIKQLAEIPHHLINVADPDRLFSAADFAQSAGEAIRDIAGRGKRVIVAGGTGLYIRALLKGLVDSPSGAGEIRRELQEEARNIGNDAMLGRLRLVDPELAAQIHPNNLVRIIRALEVHRMTGIPLSRYQQDHAFSGHCYNSLQIGIRVDRKELCCRIEDRVDRMLLEGLFDEVKVLLAAGYSRDLKAMKAIGYKEVAACLAGELTIDEATALIKRDTKRYAKRQMTWFNADPDIIWLEYPEDFAAIFKQAHDFFKLPEE